MKRIILTVIVGFLLLIGGNVTAEPEDVKEFEIIAQFGRTVTVYMSPAGLEDKYYVAQALHQVVRENPRVIMVHFYNSKQHTPKGLPMTDEQMIHQKATYNNQTEKFHWITTTNPDVSPPERKLTDAYIGPGYAE